MERVLDVRAVIRAGKEPFDDIMQAANAVEAGETLVVVAPFEPVPLYGVLGAKGFDHETTPLGGGDYRIAFRRREA